MQTPPPPASDPGPSLRDQAVSALREGRRDAAVELFQAAVDADPHDWISFTNLGVALRALGRLDEAVEAYRAARAINPGSAAVLANLGNALLDLGRCEEALQVLKAATALDPGFAQAQASLGLALTKLERYAEALPPIDRAIALDPSYAQAQFFRGNALMSLSQPREALAAYDAAIALQPQHANAHQGRGRALIEVSYMEPDGAGQLNQAMAALETALRLDPGQEEIHWTLALALLRLGRFEEGWRHYEHRWRVDAFRTGSFDQVRPSLQPRIRPELAVEDLRGRRVLLPAEQGIGDVIMFASCLPDLLSVAGEVTLACETRLHRLIAASFPGLTLRGPIPDGDTGADFDEVVPIGTLGRLFRHRREDFPGRPYLSASADAIARWSGRLDLDVRLRIGVSWRGGLATTGASARSMPLAALRPLLELPGCAFVNLQYGQTADEVAAVNAALERPIWSPEPQEVADFEDLAALVQSLDLIVSVQTAVVHLGGSTGTPVFAMVPRRPEWRYGASGETMPWYGSVRLFRQGPDADWAPVVQRVVQAVQARSSQMT